MRSAYAGDMHRWLAVGLVACGRLDFGSVPQADAVTHACDPTGFTCAGAMASATCNGRCWIWCADAVTHSEATTRCAAWQGELLPLRSPADDACWRSPVQPTGDAWLGLSQASGATPDANWSWDGDNLTLEYLDWEATQPDDVDAVEDGQEQ